MPRRHTACAMDDLLDACDRLEGLLTCPEDPTEQWTRLDRGAPAPAVESELWAAHVALHRRRRAEDRARLVAHYHDHTRRLARRFYRRGEPVDDLEQVAFEGLVLALERFDPRRRLPFLGFANPTIMGSLKRHYRDAGWALRVPRRVHDLSRPLRDAHDHLVQDLGRAPTASELADVLGVPVDEVRSAQEAERVRASTSIDAPVGDQEGSLKDHLAVTDPRFGRVEDLAALQAALHHLSEESRELLGLYFEDGLTQQEIGRRIGVSQMQVSRLLERVLAQLRSHVPAG
jgi:RNA polymerase sigma-B factor